MQTKAIAFKQHNNAVNLLKTGKRAVAGDFSYGYTPAHTGIVVRTGKLMRNATAIFPGLSLPLVGGYKLERHNKNLKAVSGGLS
jgi:hypothetical protein